MILAIFIAIAALFLWKTGVLGDTLSAVGIAVPPKLYILTASDIQEIGANFSDFTNSYQVSDATGEQSLAEAMQDAIENLQVYCYTDDSYCDGISSEVAPASDAFTAISQGSVVTTQQIQQSLAATSASEESSTTEAEGEAIAAGVAGQVAKAGIPVISQIAGFASAIISFIGSSHAAAVSKENAILCPLIPTLNGCYAYIKSQMTSGAWNGATILAAVTEVQTGAHTVIAQDSSSGALHAVGEEVDAITMAFQKIVAESTISPYTLKP